MTLQDVIKVIDELPPDELHALRLYIDQRDEEIAAYDALWDKAFEDSKDFLAKKSEEMKALYRAGLAEDFDPDTDPDLR
ncbi:MAG: hypothetical protein U0694_28690 [Anaerolineae bacterium]